MTVYYKSRQWGRDVDLDDLYIRKDIFLSGSMWVWGRNDAGQHLDNNASFTNRSSPIQVIANGTIWKQVYAYTTNTLGVKADGTLWNGGTGTSGQLGDNTAISKSSPLQTVTGGNNWYSVSGGSASTAAIKTDGTLWLWGSGNSGQLGDNTTTNRSSPVQTITGGANWKQVSLGRVGACGAIKTDGTLWMWGTGTSGQMGNNALTSRSSPVQTVAGGTDWRSISVGFVVSAIKTDGTLWLWGQNADGALGDNTTITRSSPVQTVTGGNNWKSVTQGDSYYTVAAIKTDGTLWLWGSNLYGGLGNNSTTRRSSPVQTVAGGTNWKKVGLGEGHVGAIKTDGTLWMWGDNLYGQLGTNNRTLRSSPVQTVAGGTNWIDIAGGFNHTVAIRL
jgi:alpha-tubulin suppressor-like RCC1 family protein